MKTKLKRKLLLLEGVGLLAGALAKASRSFQGLSDALAQYTRDQVDQVREEVDGLEAHYNQLGNNPK